MLCNWLYAREENQKKFTSNGKQFTSKLFRQEAAKQGIKLIYGKPHNPRGRGKIENYHRALYRELICLKDFKSLSHFRTTKRTEIVALYNPAYDVGRSLLRTLLRSSRLRRQAVESKFVVSSQPLTLRSA